MVSPPRRLLDRSLTFTALDFLTLRVIGAVFSGEISSAGALPT
jgi:hypothetical protein